MRGVTMMAFTAPDLSVTITEDEAIHAFEMYHRFGWADLESGLPSGATDTSGVPLNRHNRNLQMVAMASCAVCKRVGPEAATTEAFKLLDNPSFRALVNTMIETFEARMGNDYSEERP